MDKICLNKNKPNNIKRLLKHFFLSLNNENSKINEDNENINFNHKKRKRELNKTQKNQNFIINSKINSFENKILSFEQFQNKIREHLRAHKIKRNDFLIKNINPPIFSPKTSNTRPLLLENNFHTPNDKTINSDLKNSEEINDVINNNEKNFDYHTNKKINIRENNNNDNYIHSNQQKLLVSISSSKNKKNDIENGILKNNIIINDTKTFPIYKNGKKIIKQISISVISGITIIGFVYFTSNENQRSEIKNALNCFSLSSWIKIFVFILIVIIIFLIYYKNKEIITYRKIALEDFEILKKLLYDNYSGNKEEYIGLFHNQFIKDCSEKKNISESKYIKFVLPLINKLIKEYNEKINNINNNEINNNLVIEESDIIISGQKMKLLRYKELDNIKFFKI